MWAAAQKSKQHFLFPENSKKEKINSVDETATKTGAGLVTLLCVIEFTRGSLFILNKHLLIF